MKAIISVLKDGRPTLGTYCTAEGSGQLISNEYKSWATLERYCLANFPDGLYRVELWLSKTGFELYQKPDEVCLYWRSKSRTGTAYWNNYMGHNIKFFDEINAGDVFTPMSDNRNNKIVPGYMRGIFLKMYARTNCFYPALWANAGRLYDCTGTYTDEIYFNADQLVLRYPELYYIPRDNKGATNEARK